MDALTEEFWRRQRICRRYEPYCCALMMLSVALITAFDSPEWLYTAAIVLMVFASISTVGLIAWAWRCTDCGGGIKLNGRQCARCNRTFVEPTQYSAQSIR